MTSPEPIDRPSLETLIRRAVGLAIELVTLHIQAARNEVGGAIDQLRGAVVLLAAAVGLGVMAFVIALIALILGLAALLGVPAWAVAVVVLGILLLSAGLVAWIGLKRLDNITFVPEKTIASLNEELEWLQNWIARR